MLGRGLLFLLASLAILYAADWGVLQVRMAHQTAFSTVQVDQFLAADLKGNKQEYYHVGTVEQPCVKSIFPHVSDPPCWWLRRHTTQWKTVAGVLGRKTLLEKSALPHCPRGRPGVGADVPVGEVVDFEPLSSPLTIAMGVPTAAAIITPNQTGCPLTKPFACVSLI